MAKAKTPKLHLLTTAVDEYVASPLRGTKNDSRHLTAYLEGRTQGSDGPHGQVERLWDRDVTTANLEEAVRGLVDRLGPNDAGLWHNSGHGGYLAGGTEADKRDECLFDHQLTPIRDDTIAGWLSGIHRQARLWVVLDCCHSRTGTRAAALGVEDRGDSYRKGKFLTPNDWADGRVKAAALKARTQPSAQPIAKLARSLPIFEFAACLEWEVTYDARINGVIQGCYTRAWLDALSELDAGEGPGGYTNAALQRLIEAKLPSEEFDTHPQAFATDKLRRWHALEAAGAR